jgi:NADH:ubiquinone oxidoreductase subunit
MTLGTRLLTWLRGELVGIDAYGNRYYRERGAAPLQRGGGRFSREKSWVIYNGEPEGSKVPPEWHAWLHHTVNEVPRADRPRYPWEKPHQPNMTGRPNAYYPLGSILRGGHRPRATGITSRGHPNNTAASNMTRNVIETVMGAVALVVIGDTVTVCAISCIPVAACQNSGC